MLVRQTQKLRLPCGTLTLYSFTRRPAKPKPCASSSSRGGRGDETAVEVDVRVPYRLRRSLARCCRCSEAADWALLRASIYMRALGCQTDAGGTSPRTSFTRGTGLGRERTHSCEIARHLVSASQTADRVSRVRQGHSRRRSLRRGKRGRSRAHSLAFRESAMKSSRRSCELYCRFVCALSCEDRARHQEPYRTCSRIHRRQRDPALGSFTTRAADGTHPQWLTAGKSLLF